jgi:DNA-binding transcriptional LysR family regulator
MEVRVRGQTVFNTGPHVVNAAVSGCGLAFVTEDLAREYLRDGRLVSVMQDWCPTFPGLHAFYPSRRHSSRALGLVVDTIRYKD